MQHGTHQRHADQRADLAVRLPVAFALVALAYAGAWTLVYRYIKLTKPASMSASAASAGLSQVDAAGSH